ncbi:hypothetical protein [Clostridium senegalense]|nr:hypothetical protein [Clostridium senegalense]
MNAKELADMTIKDIAKRKKKKDDDFYAYKKEYSINKKRGWNVRYGGTRW